MDYWESIKILMKSWKFYNIYSDLRININIELILS